MTRPVVVAKGCGLWPAWLVVSVVLRSFFVDRILRGSLVACGMVMISRGILLKKELYLVGIEIIDGPPYEWLELFVYCMHNRFAWDCKPGGRY